jgi:uncharacterized membrane protein YidH (DUF202 family)
MGLLDAATDVGEYLALAFILVSFVIFLVAARKSGTVRSFQFEMLLFAVVLFAAEIPMTLADLGWVNLSAIQDLGFELHSVSMVLLASFVAYRVYGFMKRG